MIFEATWIWKDRSPKATKHLLVRCCLLFNHDDELASIKKSPYSLYQFFEVCTNNLWQEQYVCVWTAKLMGG
jgi:hypothetical protein